MTKSERLDTPPELARALKAARAVMDAVEVSPDSIRAWNDGRIHYVEPPYDLQVEHSNTDEQEAIEFPPWQEMSWEQIKAAFYALRDATRGDGPTVRIRAPKDRRGEDAQMRVLDAIIAIIEDKVEGRPE